MEPVYEVHGLCKYYGKKAALDGVDFTVEPGKLVGLLGPNGSGKTTLIKISAGLLTADSGTVCIDKAPVGVYTKAITSYLPDRMALPTEFTAADAVSLYTDFFADFDRTKANTMLADLHLESARSHRRYEQGHAGENAALLNDEPCRQAVPAGRTFGRC